MKNNFTDSTNLTKKTFDRSVCFTFFADYRITAKEIEEEFGVEDALNYYNALTDYALFEVEPNLKGAVKFLWPTTKASLDSSIERRKKGFRNEDTETTQEIIDYKNEHPEAAQREIAAAVNCSVGKVNKVLKRNMANSDTDSSFSSISTSSSEREHERSQTQEQNRKKKRDLEDLPNEELE